MADDTAVGTVEMPPVEEKASDPVAHQENLELAVEEKAKVELDPRELALQDMPPEQVAEIERVKAQGVRLHVIPIFLTVLGDEKAYYVYRTIKRQEWHKIQFEHRQRLQSGAEDITQQEAESMFEDSVVALCSVAPQISPQNIGAYDAGAVTTLADAIMFSSGFNQNSVPIKL